MIRLWVMIPLLSPEVLVEEEDDEKEVHLEHQDEEGDDQDQDGGPACKKETNSVLAWSMC